jgi:hypothetical protein
MKTLFFVDRVSADAPGWRMAIDAGTCIRAPVVQQAPALERVLSRRGIGAGAVAHDVDFGVAGPATSPATHRRPGIFGTA